MEKIGPYQIVGELQGGQIRLYRAKTADGIDAALQAIDISTLSLEGRERFRKRLDAAKALDHRNVARVIDGGEVDGLLFVAFEWVFGQPPSRGSWDERLSIMEQVCDGLSYAHQHQFVFGALTSADILVAPSGRVCIRDSGILMAAAAGARHEPATPASDIFAAGLIFYELAVGRSLQAHEAVKLSEVAPDAPEGLEFIIKKCLEKDPDNRIASAGDLRQALSLLRITLKLGSTGSTPLMQAGGFPEDPGKTKVLMRGPSIPVAPPVPPLMQQPSVPSRASGFQYCATCTTPNPPGAAVCRGCGSPFQVPSIEPAASKPTFLDRFFGLFSRKPSTPEATRVDRTLDLAISEHVPVLVPAELIALIRLPESPSLGSQLDADRDSTLGSEDVRSRPMGIDLPKDRKGKLQPTDVTMRITAPDFEPPAQEKKVRVPPHADSERLNFLLIPQQEGDLRIQFDVLQEGRAVASRLLRATAEPFQRAVTTQRLVVTVPLDLRVGANLAKLPFRPQLEFWRQFEGRTIENAYHLKRILGVGGFGGVFLADHVVEGRLIRQVAVKLILADPEKMDRQLGELVASTTLRHPNLLESFHAGSSAFENGRLLYLVMELGDEPLSARLDAGPLEPREALRVVNEITPAMVCLHDRKFVHRDIKPANVLRVSDAWKLSDFGTIRESAGPATNQTDVITGTIHYMSPESFEGIVSPAWDVWSFGILLLRAFTRQPAFEGSNDQQVMWSILRKEPSIPKDLAPPFSDIIRGCLTKDYHQRWTSARVVEAVRR